MKMKRKKKTVSIWPFSPSANSEKYTRHAIDDNNESRAVLNRIAHAVSSHAQCTHRTNFNCVSFPIQATTIRSYSHHSIIQFSLNKNYDCPHSQCPHTRTHIQFGDKTASCILCFPVGRSDGRSNCRAMFKATHTKEEKKKRKLLASRTRGFVARQKQHQPTINFFRQFSKVIKRKTITF